MMLHLRPQYRLHSYVGGQRLAQTCKMMAHKLHSTPGFGVHRTLQHLLPAWTTMRGKAGTRPLVLALGFGQRHWPQFRQVVETRARLVDHVILPAGACVQDPSRNPMLAPMPTNPNAFPSLCGNWSAIIAVAAG